MKKPDLSLILPCYNEESLLRESVNNIKATLDAGRLNYEIIFVDDKSVDGTASIIRDLCRKNHNFRYLFHKHNAGRGQTVADGIKAAEGEVTGYIDIDLEVSPIYIPEMVNLIKNDQADVVIGQRIYRATLRSILREILSRGYRLLAESLVSTEGLDTETGYKFFNRRKILPILRKTQHQHWFWDTEIIVFAKLAGLRMAELPVLFVRRLDKKSSVRIIPDVVDYLGSLWKLRKRLK